MAADVRITDLTAATSLQGTEKFEVVQTVSGSPVSRAATAAQIATYAVSSIGTLPSLSISGTSSFGGTATFSGAAVFGSTLKLNNLTYSFPSSQSSNQYLKTDGSGNLSWSTISLVTSLAGLTTDVLVVTPTYGQILWYNGSSWVNAATTNITSLGTLTSLTVSGTVGVNGITYTFPAAQGANQFLKTDGSGHLSWTTLAETVTLDGLTDVALTSASAGQVLRYNGTSWVNTSFPDLPTGGSYRISGVEVLSATSLGTGVVSSSLTSLGTLSSLTVSGTLGVNGITYTFPASQSANQFLKTDGAGHLTWATLTQTVTLDDLTDVVLTAASAGQVLRYNGTNWVNTSSPDLPTGGLYKIGGAQVLSATSLGTGVVSSSLTSVGTLASVVVSGTTSFSGVAYTWPATAGANGYVLTSDGSGTLAWSAPPSSGGGGTVSGTVGKIAKFTSASVVGDSIMAESGTTISISGALSVTGTVSVNSIAAHGAGTLTTSTTTANQVVATVPSATYRAVKFLVSVTSGTAYQVVEILAVHDGTSTYMTEYGVITTGAILAAFTSDLLAGNLRLLVTPTNAVTTIKTSWEAVAV